MKATFHPAKPAKTVKLCKECVHYKPVLFHTSKGRCTLCGEIDVVTGEIENMRADRARLKECGEDAKFFKAGPMQYPELQIDWGNAILLLLLVQIVRVLVA